MEDNNKRLKAFNFFQAELPKFEETINRKDYVYFGADNLAPQHWLDYYNYSPTHHSCISAKKDGVIGNGLFSDTPENDLRLQQANPMESVYDVFVKCATDILLFGGYSLNVVWSRDRDQGIAEFYHIDFSKLRSGKSDELDRVKEFYYCADWRNIRKFEVKTLQAFNPLEEKPSQIFYYKPYVPSAFYYPSPDYIAGVGAINTEVEIGRFHLKNIQNSFHPSLFVSLNSGIPSSEEREDIYQHLTNMYSGSDNAGKMMISFNEDKDHAPDITQISNNTNDGLFDTLNDMVKTNILTSNRITSGLLLGIRDGGSGLGSNKDEILVAYNHFLNTVIKPIQQQLLDGFSKVLFLRDGQPIDIFIEQNKILDINDEDNE